jgi:hypothetical protein
MDQRGMPPTTASVRQSADLLAQRSESTAPQTSAKIGYEILLTATTKLSLNITVNTTISGLKNGRT